MKIKALALTGIIFSLLVIASCEKQDADEAVPALIRIDSLWVFSATGQGTASHNITDAWIYVKDQFEGAFELPVNDIPVLTKGLQDVAIFPGIKMNGITNTRIPYPFYEPIAKTIELVGDSVFILEEKELGYKEDVVFKWLEDFDGGVPTVDTTTRSDVLPGRTDNKNKIFSYPGESNAYSGLIELDSEHSFFEIISKDAFVLPGNGDYVFLELNFKTDIEFTAGIFANSSSAKEQIAVLVMNPSENWKKIYVNLTHSVSTSDDAGDFNIYFSGTLPEDLDEAEVMIDNIKLLHL